jgi:hypothetical protein
MAELTFEDISDLVTGTLRHLGRLKFQQIAQELQRYEVVSHWFRKDKVQFSGGYGIQRTLMGTMDDQSAYVSANSTDSYVIPTLLDNITINWRDVQSPWGFHTDEILMNSGDPEATVVNIIKPRRVAALLGHAKQLEYKAWQVPSSTDKLLPYGLPYWVVYNATEGFNGGAPSGHTTVGGVNLTETPNFKNYTVNYTNVTKADLIKKLRTMHRKIQWRSPVDVSQYTSSSSYNDMRIYTNGSRIELLEDLGEGQNENIGRDLGAFGINRDYSGGDVMTFRRHPIIWIPLLDDTNVFTACTNPVYMINHSTFYPVCMRGKYLRESGPFPVSRQHNMYDMFIETKHNYLCVDRRQNGVAATA